jgi:predicted outer membrane repeat protein
MCRLVQALLLAVLVAAVWRSPAATVTSCDEASLRAAITQSGRVTFECSGIITLTQTIVIRSDIVIDGNGHSLTISGGNSIRLFYLDAGSRLTLSNLVFASALAPGPEHGGAIYADGASIIARGCTFISNRTARSGGAIYTQNGTIDLAHCTFASNEALTGGAVSSASGGLINSCSFISNNAAMAGGGVMAFGSAMQVINCTFFGNNASSGGALTDYSIFPVDVHHCTFVNNTPANNYLEAGVSTTLIVKNSILIDSGPASIDSNRNLHGAFESAGLGPLTSQEAISYIPLIQGSPAIDAAEASFCPTVDQRGFRRCDALCDIGSYELAGPGAIRLASAQLSVVEGASLVVEILRAAGSLAGETVDLMTSDGTAVSGRDYVGTNLTVTFEECILRKSVMIPILNDGSVNANRTFQLVLSNAIGATVIGPSIATVTILEDDSYGALSFTGAAFSTSEGSSTVILPLIRTGGSAGAVSVDYFCTDGTAIGGQDYTRSSGTVDFADGETTNHIEITLEDDERVESNEIFYITLTNFKGGASLGTWGVATITLTENDSEVLFWASSYHSLEDRIANIAVIRRGYLSNEASIQFQMSDLSALAGEDYVATNRTLIFSPGQSNNVIGISILADSIDEPRESLRLTLSNPTGTLLGQPAIATLTIGDTELVSACDDASLRDALAVGRKVTFACDGAIVLSGAINILHDTILDGAGRNVRISGGGGRIFNVETSATVMIKNLFLVDSVYYAMPGYGGAIANTGHLHIANCVFSNNVASGASAPNDGLGGAIYNAGDLYVTNCLFVNNVALGGNAGVIFTGGASAKGGAICNFGRAYVWDTVFETNAVQGGNGFSLSDWPFPATTPGGGAFGGAIFSSGPLFIFRSSFGDNIAIGGTGASTYRQWVLEGHGGHGATGGPSAGGALYSVTADVVLVACAFEENRSAGGAGGTAASGRSATRDLAGNGGHGGSGGHASGGAVHAESGSLRITNCSFYFDSVLGGDGGRGGDAGTGDYPRGVGGVGGNGGPGGNALGGHVRAANADMISVNNTFSWGASIGGSGAPGGAAGETWYIGYPDGLPGLPGNRGVIEGQSIAANLGFATLLNTIIAYAFSNDMCSGTIIDAGHNLCSTHTCLFTNATSLNDVDPLLTDLTNFGGFTKSMALLPGSPAANAGSHAAFPPEDQRGVPRPQGSRCDIGAFEVPALQLSRTYTDGVLVSFYVLSSQQYALEGSLDLASWSTIETGVAAATGPLSFSLPTTSTSPRFLRVLFP